MGDSGFIPVHGGRLYYEADGSGTPLVCVHAGVANLRQWDPHIAAWAERHQVIRYDTRGYGKTESDPVEFANRADLAAVLDHFGADAAHILGCSRGGQISLDFAVENPERVLSFTSVAGGVGNVEANLPKEVEDAIIAFDQSTARMAEAKDWAAVADAETAYWFDGPGQPADRADPAIRAMVREWIYSNYAAEIESGTPQPLEPSADTQLNRLTMPVLAVVGERDEAWAVASMKHLAAAVPNGRFELLEDAAHLLNLEYPERFTRLILDFIGAGPERGLGG
jgi:pimeloyl-ACP methyl ester carboxylesterase